MFDGKMSASDDPNPKWPKLMEVASHAARKRQQENVNDQQAEFNDSGMDKEISPYHQGDCVLIYFVPKGTSKNVSMQCTRPFILQTGLGNFAGNEREWLGCICTWLAL